MTTAEIGAEIDRTAQAVQAILKKAQSKVGEQLLQRFGHTAVRDLARDEALRHDDPRRLR